MRPTAALHHHAAAIVRDQRRGESVGRIEDTLGGAGGSVGPFVTFRVRAYTAGAGGVASAAIAGRRITNLETGDEEPADTTVYVREASLAAEQTSLAPTTVGNPPQTRYATAPRVVVDQKVVAWYGSTRYGSVTVTGWHALHPVEKFGCP